MFPGSGRGSGSGETTGTGGGGATSLGVNAGRDISSVVLDVEALG